MEDMMKASRVLLEINELRREVSQRFGIIFSSLESTLNSLNAAPMIELVLDCCDRDIKYSVSVRRTVLFPVAVEEYTGVYDDDAVQALLTAMSTAQFWEPIKQELSAKAEEAKREIHKYLVAQSEQLLSSAQLRQPQEDETVMTLQLELIVKKELAEILQDVPSDIFSIFFPNLGYMARRWKALKDEGLTVQQAAALLPDILRKRQQEDLAEASERLQR
jgi:hypothetical protein